MKTINRKALVAGVCVVVFAAASAVLYSHCQIPCGIYDDPARFDQIAENITTLEKSMNQINELSAAEKPNYNQIVRWIDTKEFHADGTMKIITAYFMAQRLKPVGADSPAYAAYVRKLTLLHSMAVECMKAKQSTDLAQVETLRSLLAEFRAAYFAGEPK